MLTHSKGLDSFIKLQSKFNHTKFSKFKEHKNNQNHLYCIQASQNKFTLDSVLYKQITL